MGLLGVMFLDLILELRTFGSADTHAHTHTYTNVPFLAAFAIVITF